ncbi:radical SAM protein [Reichenbachiella agarivorans]|uniref:Radical SAM protein n=1 Tax=Reichenbachiella agarivorans TaxID=2979464 RepID=A0ABY6CKI6_9BACT|nr:radical SAM protein [Reichenbachiella agarivorans]UXP30595.1 radical SAM protein [Reichenbachiella agarivorans]
MRIIHHPILCNYYVTYRCNAKCGFCDIWEKPSPYVTLDQVKSNLLELKKLGVKIIDFTGGEPLLHREIDQFFAYAKELGFITTLTTNALLYPKYAEKLKGKVDMLHFSLDTADGAQHDTWRGVACYDHVMESIQIAKSLGERPDILMTVFEENIEEIARLYQEICLPNDLVLILNPSFDYNEVETGSGLSQQSLKKLTQWGKKKNIYLNQAFIKLRRDGGNQTDNPVCKAASTTLVINPYNELVVPCYHLGIKSFPINGQLKHLYQSTEVKQLIELEGKLPACQGCTINCYMQPSFAVEVNKYFWSALPSTLKYNWVKGTWRQLFNS